MEAWPKRSPTPIEENCGVETRSLVLGHLQRGGQPISYDRLLALRFGAAAIELVKRGDFGSMVSLDPPDVRAVPLGEALAQIKMVPVQGDIVQDRPGPGDQLRGLSLPIVSSPGGP